jgi:TIR domain
MIAPVNRGFARRRGRLALHRRPDIFISHSSRDKAFVRKLVQNLNKVGVDAWLDEWELDVGESLHRSLGLALEKSRFVGIIISPKFVASEGV